MKTFKRVLYWVAQCTWGILETTIGMLVALVLLCLGNKPKKFAHTFYFAVHYSERAWGGFSLGPVIVTWANPSESLLQHEYGHTIQNIIFGPAMSFIVSIPSMCRYWLRELYSSDKHNWYNVIEISLAAVCIILFGIGINCLTTHQVALFFIVWGIAIYLLIISAFIAFEYFRYKQQGLTEYNSIWFEKTASKLGEKFSN